MTKKAILLSAVLFLFLASCQNNRDMTRAISTIFPTKDWVISDFIVTDFGARAEPGFDNREAFQAAIDAAHYAGGGVVFIPAGNYEFHSTRIGTVNARVRQGELDFNQQFEYQYTLRVHQSVQLRGDWIDPLTNGGKVQGTF